ncbi:Thiamine kinase [Candidatus Lokiarchaeum ossiferum]
MRTSKKRGDMMKNFEQINPSEIEDPARNLLKKLGKQIECISFLGRGECSAVFKIETKEKVYCLKTALFPERKRKVLNEAKIREDFISKGLKFVPAPVYNDDTFFPKGAVLFDFIEGENSKFTSPHLIQQMARHLASIHQLQYEIIPDGMAQMMNNYQNLIITFHHIETDYPFLINPDITQAFTQALQEYKELLVKNGKSFPIGLSGILHGDLSNNFITDPQEKIWLIDWENSEYGDILEEISMFLFDNEIDEQLQEIFLETYAKAFPPASQVNMKILAQFYIQLVPAFNVCYGMDQLATNLKYNMEPERKLRDIAQSAKNWESFFSHSTCNLIKKGISQLIRKLEKDYHLNVPLQDSFWKK